MKITTKRSTYRCFIDWDEMQIRVIVKEHWFWWIYRKVWEMQTSEFENYTNADRQLNCHLAVAQYEKSLQKKAMEKNEALP